MYQSSSIETYGWCAKGTLDIKPNDTASAYDSTPVEALKYQAAARSWSASNRYNMAGDLVSTPIPEQFIECQRARLLVRIENISLTSINQLNYSNKCLVVQSDSFTRA